MKSTKRSALSAFQMLRCGFICGVLLQTGELAFADDWPTYQHDSAHTGRSSSTFNPTILTKKWGLTNSSMMRPVVAGNSLYNLRGNTLTSFNVFNGQQNWSATTIGSSADTLTFAEGMLVSAGTAIGGSKLFVWDAATGVQKYTVDLPQINASRLMPTIARNSNNQLVAYLAGSLQSNGTPGATAVALGTSSGSVMWTSSGSFGTQSMPTIVGSSIILAGPDQYYALDQLTGAANHFHAGSISGGGGTTVPFDSARSQFYVRDPILGFLTAYSYSSNSVINQKWQIPESHFSGGGSVSIGSDGGIYMVTQPGSIVELDPEDGHVLHSLSGLNLTNNTTPALTATSIFVYQLAIGPDTTEVFDLNTFSHVTSLPRGRLDYNTPYSSPGAAFDNGYVLYYQLDSSNAGFDVYIVAPEPSSILLSIAPFVVIPPRRRKPTSRHHV